MRTEIVVPFAFDTTPIEKRLQDEGTAIVDGMIAEMVRDGIKKNMPMKSYQQEVDWKSYIDYSFGRFLERHAQEIVDEAAMLLAAKGGRKKTWRQVLQEVRDAEVEQ